MVKPMMQTNRCQRHPQSTATHQAKNKADGKRSEHGFGGIPSHVLVSILP
jgi:hypothetical protein